LFVEFASLLLLACCLCFLQLVCMLSGCSSGLVVGSYPATVCCFLACCCPDMLVALLVGMVWCGFALLLQNRRLLFRSWCALLRVFGCLLLHFLLGLVGACSPRFCFVLCPAWGLFMLLFLGSYSLPFGSLFP
jgi:hypothetical protein